MSVTHDPSIIEAAAQFAADSAAAADRGASEPANALARYGALGALRLGFDDPSSPTRDLTAFAQLIEAVGSECLSSAFSLWAHRMVLEYLRASDAEAAPALIDDLLAGRRAGSIAMATALQELSGVGTVNTVAVPVEGGYQVSGFIAWASNIGPGTVIVFPARVGHGSGSDGDAERIILATVVGEPGLVTRPVEDLLALGATRSASLSFDGHFVPATHLVANSLLPAKVHRTPHLLLQSAFCLGLAGRSLREAAEHLGPAPDVLADHNARLQESLRGLRERIFGLLADLAGADTLEVTLARYEVARLAGTAARHEAALVGGRGYVTTTATNRRMREACFLPVQSPSEVQLVHELERLGSDPSDHYVL